MKVSSMPRSPVRDHAIHLPRAMEKSVIIHKDENGFGLRIKGQSPVFIEHVHENGAAWRAGIRALDLINKVNGIPVSQLNHKDVVMAFKTCNRLVALTLISADQQQQLPPAAIHQHQHQHQHQLQHQNQDQQDLPVPPAPKLSSLRWPLPAAVIGQISATSHGSIKQSSSKCRATLLANKMSPSMSVNSLPAIDNTQNNNPRTAVGKPSPLLTSAAIGQARQQLNKTTPNTPAQSTQMLQAQLRPQSASHATLATTGTTATATAPGKRPVIDKRVEIIREFIDTERAHTERLRCLNELFYRPLKQAGFMSVDQLRLVFSCHRTLYKIHRQIYRILISANYDACSEPLIGSALLEIFEGDLKRRLERASCTFCSAQATNIELLNKLTRRDTKAGEFLAQVTSQQMIGRLGVKDLLASCFQRLTKYPLLLENLLKATPLELPEDLVEVVAPAASTVEIDYGPAGGGGTDSDTRNPTAAISKRHYQGASSPVASRFSRHRRRRLGEPESISGADERPSTRRRDVQEEVDSERKSGDDVELATNEAARGAELSDDDEDDEDEDVNSDVDDDENYELLRQARLGAAAAAAAEEAARRNSRRIMAIGLAEEREFIERALQQSRQILVRVNDSIKVAIARNRLKEIWKRTDKYPDVPLSSIDISKQQVVHEGLLTLRLSRRSFDVYVLLLNDYIIILTREGQDKYRLKFFTPEGKSPSFQSSAAAAAAANSSSSSSSLGTVRNILGANSNAGGCGGTSGAGLGVGANNIPIMTNNLIAPHQTVYSPIFVIDEHLTTRDAATDENGFYLLCKRKDDSRIYEFASRSPAERLKWRDKIQSAIEKQMSRKSRRPSCASTLTKSSSEVSTNEAAAAAATANNSRRNTDAGFSDERTTTTISATINSSDSTHSGKIACDNQQRHSRPDESGSTRTTRTISGSRPSTPVSEPTKIVGTISYVTDDEIVMPSKMEFSRVFVDQAIQVNILDGSTTRG